MSGLAAFDNTHLKYFWRNVASDPQTGVAYAVWAKHLGYHTVAKVFQSGAGNQGIVLGVETGVRHAGLHLSIDLTIPGEAASYASVVSRIISSKPQALLSDADPQTESTLFAQYSQQNHGAIPPVITGTDNLSPQGFTVFKTALGTNFATHSVTMLGQAEGINAQAVKAFSYGLTHSQLPKEAAPALAVLGGEYDGGIIMALAADAAKSTSGSVFNQYIAKVSTARPGAVVVHTYAQGLAALKAGKQIDFVGTEGQAAFDQYQNSPGTFEVVGFNKDGSTRPIAILPGKQIAAAGG
jgi:branched-chain amino acid transport system substrate-binding protein